MISITEGNNLGDLLKYEVSNLYSRDTVSPVNKKIIKIES